MMGQANPASMIVYVIFALQISLTACSPILLHTRQASGLPALGGANIYLTSLDDVTENPTWLSGVKPDTSGRTGSANTSVVVVNDHGDGTVDAFYFYFYSFNLGNKVAGDNRGNHVGDW